MNTAVEIAGVKFKNPVITASGTFGLFLSPSAVRMPHVHTRHAPRPQPIRASSDTYTGIPLKAGALRGLPLRSAKAMPLRELRRLLRACSTASDCRIPAWSIVMTGFTHTFLTASVTLRTLSGCTPKAMPPLRTLGQEILSSTISALLAAYTIVRDLEEYCKASDLDINTLVGTLQLN